jgi:hypothetical protein
VLLNTILVKTALNDLRKTLPAAFKSISIATINHYYHLCCSITDAYIDGHKYGTKAFAERKSHRQVVGGILTCILITVFYFIFLLICKYYGNYMY